MSTTRKALFTLAALGLAAFAAHPVSAQTTITNGSFEANSFMTFPGYVNSGGNGTITGWTATGGAGLNPYTSGQNNDGTGPNPFANNGKVPDGNQVAFLQGGGTTLTQTLNNLIVGNQYQISFYDNSRTNYAVPTLDLTVGGQQLYSAAITPVDSYQSFNNSYNFVTGTYTATATSADLVFANTTSGSADATALIDNVGIRNLGAASAAPEPSQMGMLALLAVGLGALAVKARKRSAAAQTA